MPISTAPTITVTLGGVDIDQWIQADFEVGSETLVEENTGFGEIWRKYLPVGIRDVPDIPITGFFEFGVGSPDATIGEVATGPNTPTSDLVVTWGPGRTTTVPVRVTKFSIRGVYNGITKFTATLKQGGPRVDVRP